MFIEVVALFFTLILFTFLGYAFHRMFHRRWSGRFYVAHMNHHLKQYPVSDFYSDEYRDPGSDSTVYLFALLFSPILITMVLLTVFHIVSLFLGLSVLAEMLFIGWVNNSLHDSFHLRKTFWHRFWFFDRLVKLHFNHHLDQNTNFGIFSFVWDRLFRTFFDIIDRP